MATKKQFEAFCKECNRYIDIFGITEYFVNYQHDKIDNDEWQAGCTVDIEGMNAIIILSNNISMTNYEVRAAAKHEVLELLLGKLNLIMKSRTITAREIDTERHTVINRLLRVKITK